MSKFDHRGHELPDPTPVAIPVGLKRPESLQDQIRRLVRNELSAHAVAHGRESFEEADDFEVEDDPPDPRTPWELDFDQLSEPSPHQAPRDDGSGGGPARADAGAPAPPPPANAQPVPPPPSGGGEAGLSKPLPP